MRNQYATALDDLLPEYGSEILDVINEEDLAACTIGGTLYALPTMKDNRRAAGMAMRRTSWTSWASAWKGWTPLTKSTKSCCRSTSLPDMYCVVPS